VRKVNQRLGDGRINMGIRSSAFGGTTLSGRDATKFQRMIARPAKNAEAAASVRAGRRLLKEFRSSGAVRVSAKKKPA
jgi:hypothetical protein